MGRGKGSSHRQAAVRPRSRHIRCCGTVQTGGSGTWDDPGMAHGTEEKSRDFAKAGQARIDTILPVRSQL